MLPCALQRWQNCRSSTKVRHDSNYSHKVLPYDETLHNAQGTCLFSPVSLIRKRLKLKLGNNLHLSCTIEADFFEIIINCAFAGRVVESVLLDTLLLLALVPAASFAYSYLQVPVSSMISASKPRFGRHVSKYAFLEYALCSRSKLHNRVTACRCRVCGNLQPHRTKTRESSNLIKEKKANIKLYQWRSVKQNVVLKVAITQYSDKNKYTNSLQYADFQHECALKLDQLFI